MQIATFWSNSLAHPFQTVLSLAGAGAAFLIIGVIFVAALFGLALTAFWVWMLIDCVRNRYLKDDARVVWALVIFFTHLIGAFVYYLTEYSGRKRNAPLYVSPYIPNAQVQAQQPPLYQQGYQASREQAYSPEAHQPDWHSSELPRTSYPEQSEPPLQQ
ncbi:PLD nuclease N-terminal domain-containing protein [Ktedonobacter racemifer]|uniref:Cardiolipin synthase N-terminal domain-containing protein n=1 Tax=Ktedonobacter racemifer DSM 44963 TaxID=485913 RepID=D6TZ80_KTERA|nr:PLD nuclease N-terminal domain-containing protein [Ktedonobacter racemifer]EFH81870.1 hypothetical protein Krac_2627 [Ktedonobacter racemifer DSM 44963]